MLNIKKLSKILSKKLNRDIVITGMNPMGGGYHSDGFKLTTENDEAFFIKKFKSNDLGFELPERKINSLLISNEMSKRSKHHPKGLAIITGNNEKHQLNDDTEIYHLQEFIPGLDSDSKNYWQLLNERKNKEKIDSQDLEELNVVIDTIINIHKNKHPGHDKEHLKRVYGDGLRSVLTSPELTYTLLTYYGDNDKVLSRDKHPEYISLMLKNIYKWEGRSDRLCALHGDFWGTNLFFTKKGVYLIDFSRIPWGEPGIDIGFWIAQYLWFYYETKNIYFKNLLEKFFEIYIQKTGDNEITESVSLTMGLMGVIYTNPKLYPDLNTEVANKFMDNIWRILKAQKFTL